MVLEKIVFKKIHYTKIFKNNTLKRENYYVYICTFLCCNVDKLSVHYFLNINKVLNRKNMMYINQRSQ